SPGAKNLKPLNLDNVYEIDSTILSDANKDNKERALFKKIRDYEYENSNLLKDAILINYDSGLLNTIHKYFSNNENLKEHSIFLRTFTSTRLMPLWYGGVLSNATYSYEIIKINEIFMKCITNLKDNYQLQKPLACKDNIHHIEADNDSNPNNNKLIGNLIHNDKNVA
ncbi:lipase, partial [Helicobacter sp. MIT 14-3879]